VLDELLTGLLAVLAEVNAAGEAKRGDGQIRLHSRLETYRDFSHPAKR
jgi:hypothetical protein